MIPFLLIGPLLADLLNQQFTMPWPIEVLSSVLVGGGYAIALAALLRPAFRFDPALASMRDLVLLMAAGGAERGGRRGRLCRPHGYRRATAAAGSHCRHAALLGWRRHRHHGHRPVRALCTDAPTRAADDDETLLQFVAIGLALALVFSLSQSSAIPVVLRSLPADHLARRAHRLGGRQRRHPVSRNLVSFSASKYPRRAGSTSPPSRR